ncbi:MAG: LysM peptidoglycan-binding domain-containing protein [Candidatus Rariloculaceae bacterium]
MKRLWSIFLVVFASGVVHAQTANLPRPAGIEPDVQFWVRVYTEVNTRSGFIHDSKHLGVVYRTVRFEDGASRRQRTRQINDAYQEIRDLLAVLADGKRENLTPAEESILSLWPDDVSNAELRASSGNLRFQLGQSDRFRAGLIRSGIWRSYIEVVLADRGLPPELVALPHVESSFDPTAYSKVGAAGMWQFTRSTGLRYMRIDHIIDERRDPFISTVAASRLLENNFGVLQSWPLAITAYNHGQAGMRRAVRQQGTDEIETILRNYEGRTFGFASRNFYVAFLAAVQVDQNYEDYFGPLEFESAAAITVVEVPAYVTVATLQAALDTDRGVLRSWNPALTDAVWGGDKFVPRGFELRLPSEMVVDPAELFDSVAETQRYAAQMPDIIHRVRSGDTVSGIADRYGVSMTSLVQLNGLRSRNFIRAGQVLRLPGSDGSVPLTLAQLNGDQPIAPEAMPSSGSYVVRSGDSIDVISRRFGVPEEQLLARNGIANKNRIYVGQELFLDTSVTEIEEIPAEVAFASVESAPAVAPASAVAAVPEATSADMPAAEAVVAATEDAETLEPGPLEFQPAERIPAPPIFIVDTGETLAEDAALAAVTDSLGPEAEPEPEFAEDENVLSSAQAEMAADPSDYLVSTDNTIEVQALETLGHYADWLGIRTQRLRDINGMLFERAVVIGQRLELDFSEIDRTTFEQRRVEYQQRTQEAFFLAYQITGTRDHVVRSGESLWVLALRRYRVPVWLLRQFNPDLDLDRVTPDTVVKFPELQVIAADDNEARASTVSTAGVSEDI